MDTSYLVKAIEAASAVEERQGDGDEPAAEASPLAQDIENPRTLAPPKLAVTNPSVGILASSRRRKGKNKSSTGEEEKNSTKEAGDDSSSTDSVFSFDSYENLRRIPLRFQSVTTTASTTNNINIGSTTVPFPSVNIATTINEIDGNICPCRCLFFTLKETICLVLSALGCAVFLAGLIILCMYLDGSLIG
jgi:hypothetical protein